jgi:hypothetical protein
MHPLGSRGARVRGVQTLQRQRTGAMLNPGPLSPPELHPHHGDEHDRCVPRLGTRKRGLQRDVRPPPHSSVFLVVLFPRPAVRVRGSRRFLALMSLDLMTGLRKTVGADKDVRPLYERALRVREKTLGSEHAVVAESLAPREHRPEVPDARPLEGRRGRRLALPLCGLRQVALGRREAGGHTGGAAGDAVAGRMDPWIDPTFQYA